MKTRIPFDNSFAALTGGFFSHQAPEPAPAPTLIAYNLALGAELGIEAGDDLAEIFSGASVPGGAEPLAQLYAGHQFGNYNPQLGDGRAVLLGEVISAHGARRDIQLKGSGRTPYSRGGDGKAWLGPVLREYVVSEAMHALGIPTTRALAATSTGESVYREGAKPGAIVTRVAASHIRVGTFQVFAARGQIEQLQTLAEYTIARHYPDANGPEGLLQAAMDAQASLIPKWMGVGFIHGVMNTDNCQIAGETIDYGPCAFMDAFASDRVFSSIDRNGRYSFANQPDIAIWNMAQLATALLPLMPDPDAAVERFTVMLHAMKDDLRAGWLSTFAAKLGIAAPIDTDAALITDLLALMETGGADFTNTFNALTRGDASDEMTDRSAYGTWHARWQERLKGESGAQALMATSNPVIIPRNHRIEQMIDAAVAGDFALFQRLDTALKTPFTERANIADLKRPPSKQEIVPATFCGT
ncbi:protein adenylyltransferase SelO [Planktotalea arctica]|uniref:protein adenylyltransferase SelO n=1 Tax=Planktotalea arctica TaxID=1481893 RepID=UPI000A176AA9|nr:YdiU family protein [Planktotalea arctica]